MYGKVFVQMYDGTLGTQGPWQALVTFHTSRPYWCLPARHRRRDGWPIEKDRGSTMRISTCLLGARLSGMRMRMG